VPKEGNNNRKIDTISGLLNITSLEQLFPMNSV
jgi:hypothetical protein